MYGASDKEINLRWCPLSLLIVGGKVDYFEACSRVYFLV